MRRHRVCPNPVERSPVSGDKLNPHRIAQECVVSTLIEAGNRIGRIGFAPGARRKPGQRRARALVQLIAATGLVISLVVARDRGFDRHRPGTCRGHLQATPPGIRWFFAGPGFQNRRGPKISSFKVGPPVGRGAESPSFGKITPVSLYQTVVETHLPPQRTQPPKTYMGFMEIPAQRQRPLYSFFGRPSRPS